MKVLRLLLIIMFSAVVLVPVIFFNFDPSSVSVIDNRELAKNPLTNGLSGDLTDNIENYVSDRIGFRDKMILAYTIINDRLFNKMVHPTYTYGKDGYIFGGGITTDNNFGDFHITFADMVEKIQNYCEARNIPFLFVFNPAKPAIYSDEIADGINYNREWVDMFFEELDKRGINYLDNTVTLKEQDEAGTAVFNKKFDANHWNDIGAFYGTQKMMERLKENMPSVHVNELSEFNVSDELQTSLLVSEFPINEYVPKIGLKSAYTSFTSAYSDIELNPSYKGFGYYSNDLRKSEGCPGVLTFQGSYMNKYGYKYMINSFGEYIHVHDYQNVIDFPYYFNIFKPDCVIFEVAEYTFMDSYFNLKNMKKIQYNPVLSSIDKSEYSVEQATDKNISIEKGETLTKITWKTDSDYKYVWLKSDDEYDMRKCSGGYELTVETSDYNRFCDSFEIAFSNINR